MDHSHHLRVKYFWEALDLSIPSVILGESPDPQIPYPPRPLWGGGIMGRGGLKEGKEKS